MKQLLQKIKSAAAFTLTELLATVLISMILLGISVPVVNAVRRDYDFKRLDAAAQVIYITAQNRLTTLRAAGSLSLVNPGDNHGVEGAPPGGIVHIDQNDSAFSNLFPSGTLDETLSGDIVVEFNPTTGSVFGVFYSEGDFETASVSKTYNAAQRTLDARKKVEVRVGYYGYGSGGAASVGEAAVIVMNTTPRLVNAEELSLRVMKGKIVVPDESPAPKGDLQYTVSVTNAQNNKQIYSGELEDFVSDVDKFNDDEALGVGWILDSLAGPHFAGLDNTDDLKASLGEDIIVSLTVSYKASDYVAKPYTWSTRTNSLFASRNESGGKDTISVACGRHLQNLETGVSGFTTDAPFEVNQTDDIDWSKLADIQVTGKTGGWFNSTSSNADDLAPKGYLYSINNVGLTAYNGNFLRITGLKIAPNGDYAGLFANCPTTVQNVVLVNPLVDGGKMTEGHASAAGTLAGKASACKIENCSAYLDGPAYDGFNVQNATTAGGLIGEATVSTISNSFAAVSSVTGITRAGGLVGQLSADGHIDACYADCTNVTAPTVGGLIGSMNDGTVSNSYALGKLSGTSAAGGFAGMAGGKISNCYAAATFNPAVTTAVKKGFVATGSATYADCYYLIDAIDGAVKDTTTIQGINPISYRDLWTQSGKFCKDSTHEIEVIDDDGNETRVIVQYFTKAEDENAHDYNRSASVSLQGNVIIDKQLVSEIGDIFPFPKLDMDHYGNWPLPKLNVAFVYYEYYADKSFAFHGYDLDGVEITYNSDESHLLNDTKSVLEDGYAVLCKSGKTISFRTNTDPQSLDRSSLVMPNTATSFAGASLYLLPYNYLQKQSLAETNKCAFQINVEDKLLTLWFNPAFADTVNHSKTMPTFEPMQIRTARQLSNLSALTHAITPVYGTEKTYNQMRDIDYAAYNCGLTAPGTKLIHTRIGGGSKMFNSTYDGHSHVITGIEKISNNMLDPSDDNYNSDYTGLFGLIGNNAVLKNIVFRGIQRGTQIVGQADKDKFSQNSGLYTGGLIGRMSGGTVTNCVVSDCIVQDGVLAATDGNFVGGFVGWQEKGTISNCQSDNISVSSENAKQTYVGGFAGKQAGKITNCYTLGAVQGTNASAVGGFVAAKANDTNSITNCYSASTLDTSMNGTGKIYAFSPTPVSTITNYWLSNAVTAASVVENSVPKKTYSEMQSINVGGDSAASTYAYNNTGTYPFPAVVQNSEGKYVHYGDWPPEPASSRASTSFLQSTLKVIEFSKSQAK